MKNLFKNFIFAVAILLAAANSKASNSNAPFFSALDLAIQHFSKDGVKEIKTWGPEHSFMMAVLGAVEAQIPELAGSSTIGSVAGEKRFSTLMTEVEIEKESDEKLAAQLFREVGELVEGCGYEKKTVIDEQDLGFVDADMDRVITTSYHLESRPGSKKPCLNPIAAQLAEAGVNILEVQQQHEYGTARVVVSLKQSVNIWQDMRYVKSKILSLPGLSATFVSKLNVFGDGYMIGSSRDIQLKDSTGNAKMSDKLTLVYYVGSGDCPAGCINKTYYTVDVTPLPDFKFDVKLVSVTGNDQNNFSIAQ